MFKYPKIILLITILSMELQAEIQIQNENNVNLEKLQQLFYEKGLKKGLKKGYAEGYEMALRDAKEKILEYSTKIEAYENGKFLFKKGIYSAPETYQYTDRYDGSTRIVTKGCKIIKKISPKDIIDLPLYPNDLTQVESKYTYTDNNTNSSNDDIYPVSNSVKIVDRDMIKYKSANPSLEYQDKEVVIVKNSSYYTNRLSKANIDYTLSSNGTLKVILKNKKTKKFFYDYIYND